MRIMVDEILKITENGGILCLIADEEVWFPMEALKFPDEAYVEVREGQGDVLIELSEKLAIEKGVEDYAEEE